MKKVIPFPSIHEPTLEAEEEEGDEDEEDDLSMSQKTQLARAIKQEKR